MTQVKNTFFTGTFAAMACTLLLLSSSAVAVESEPVKDKVASVNLVADSVVKTEKLHRSANMTYKVAGKRYYPLKKVSSFSETGNASWYGPGFHGRKTSNGERFDMNALTAAHRSLPLNCYIRVTNKTNGKSVVVKVNDRGPFHSGRVLDLSYGAAKRLGITNSGTGNVTIERVDNPNS